MIMAVRDAKKRICEVVGSWNGVTMAPHRFGGTQFRLGNREIGHIHGDSLVDIPFPKAMRDQFVKDGDAEPHHIFPQSGWVSLFLRTESDVERAIRLLRASFELAVSRHAAKAVSAAPPR
jgi:luciferase-like monooxygenase